MFDVNDFDETLPGPWEWDVKRLAASIAVADRSVTLDPGLPGEAVRSMVWAYRRRMAQLSTMAPLDVWYERVDVDAVLALARKQNTSSLPTVERLVAQARHHTSLHALPKLTQLVDGERRIIEDPPLILHAYHESEVPREVIEGLEQLLGAGLVGEEVVPQLEAGFNGPGKSGGFQFVATFVESFVGFMVVR